MIGFDGSRALSFLEDGAYAEAAREAEQARSALVGRNGAGREFLGWMDWPVNYDREEYARIKAAAARIRREAEYLVVIGIGGSYLGARAAAELLTPPFGGTGTRLVFCGHQLSPSYMHSLLKMLRGKRFCINVISKSGTTTEPAIAFRLVKKLLEEQLGREEAAKRIYATTDRAKGALKSLAEQEGYECFTVPEDIGGRYSVLTAVGLLPIAAAGIDTDALLQGAAGEREHLLEASFEDNEALRYAALREALYRGGKRVEMLTAYEPGFHYVSEWWKQLFGESEGKDGKALFPAAADLTTDLHSMGQYMQDGERILLETVVDIADAGEALTLEAEENNADGLNYLAGRDLDFVNRSALMGTVAAHTEGNVPVSLIRMDAMTPRALGELFYFFEFACAVSGYMLGVNPFDQPGVERYKKNMFALLGKPEK